jgi:dGTPase
VKQEKVGTIHLSPEWLESGLSPLAQRSSTSLGRAVPEEPCTVRTAFQRDRDRIVHSKSFRRLKHKTQVFISPEGDHYRTRLTHTLEVSGIARTVARALRLNEDLTEAIALGHDLGHTPFGHWGERVLDKLMPGGFTHTAQSLRVVDLLERDGLGLNLTWEVRNGIARHSKGKSGSPTGDDLAATLEGQSIRVSDLVAYVNHDTDDAIRAGLLVEESLPASAVGRLGRSPSERIGRMVRDVVMTTREAGLDRIRMSDDVLSATLELRAFLFSAVYEKGASTSEFRKATDILGLLWAKVHEHPDEFLVQRTIERDGIDAAARDFLAGMTDRYAVGLFERLFIPRPWVVAAGAWQRD